MRPWFHSGVHCHVQVASVFPALLLWEWHNSQGTLSGQWGTPPAIWNGHRPWGMITGHWLSSRPSILGRSALKVASRPKLPAESCFDSSRGQNKAWQCIPSKFVHQHIPYHVNDSKWHGSWFSDHQSRISMRDGPRDQVCHFDFKCNAKHINIQGSLQPLSWLNQEVRHACQCNTT